MEKRRRYYERRKLRGRKRKMCEICGNSFVDIQKHVRSHFQAKGQVCYYTWIL